MTLASRLSSLFLTLILTSSALLIPGTAQSPQSDPEACLEDPDDVDQVHYDVDVDARVLDWLQDQDVPDPGEVPVPPRGPLWPDHWFGGSIDFEVTYEDGCLDVAVKAPVPTLAPLQDHGGEPDQDGNGMGDAWQEYWEAAVGVLVAGQDLDSDGLVNVDEYRWQTMPACLPYDDIPLPPEVSEVHNCTDHEANRTTGHGGDGWRDGDEVRYWNNPLNDLPLGVQTDDTKAGVAYLDPDRLLDSDGDQLNNTSDPDSDEDGWLDGDEVHLYGTYPEFRDSDCEPSATACTPVASTSYYNAGRVGKPGTGDGMTDSAEWVLWNEYRADSWLQDADGDGIPPLLDPDSDNDALLDTEEFLLGQGQVKPDVADCDQDGLLDGEEAAWHQDSDGDGLLNANDPDSDNDGMPDAWESRHGFSMVLAADAALDRDEDRLSNLREYQLATNPNSPDSEGDFVHDGDEVLTHQTNPLWWDTDLDGMADAWELQYGFNPRNPADAAEDPDGDSYDSPPGGPIEKPWTNLHEYRYGRVQDPWLGGTDPGDFDTDDDGAPDGMEAYHQSDPRLRGDNAGDEDEDGLNWTEEVSAGTWVDVADSDFDGLCDGGRAAQCRFPGMGTQGNMPGERDYGSSPRLMDTDRDGDLDNKEAQYWDPGASGTTPDLDGDFLNGVIDRDSDGDALADGGEWRANTNKTLPDTDNDGLLDGEEWIPGCYIEDYCYLAVYDEWIRGSDPRNPDTDGDGLRDGDERKFHRTKVLQYDSDWDEVNDGSEVRRGMNPLSEDSDQDGMRDGYERDNGLEPTVDDAAADLDADGLSNLQEYRMGTNPRQADSDGDSMPDGWEAQCGLDPASNTDRASDLDADGLANHLEYQAGSLPNAGDTDGDRASDGFEYHTLKSNPLAVDSDGDGGDWWGDWDEYDVWVLLDLAWDVNHDGDTYANGIVDSDSDNDGLNDFEEFGHTHTNPTKADTDGDGVRDFDEVVVHEGRQDPNDPDTDDDGTPDTFDPPQAQAVGDRDQDGFSDADEAEFGTDPDNNDSDCDGVKDGAEYYYWGNAWNWGGNRLLTPDVDGDGILDGVEIGPVGTPPDSVYRTLPDDEDSDGDGLLDDEEARSNVRVTCGSVEGAASMQAPPALGGLPSGMPLGALEALAPRVGGAAFVQGGSGVTYGVDAAGVFLRGGYGVRLYLTTPDALQDPAGTLAGLASGAVPMMAAGGPRVNGERTDPTKHDTDGDGLWDGDEVLVTGTDPVDCDSDHDALGDGVELGIDSGTSHSDIRECQQRDRAQGIDVDTDPLNSDSDGDGILDGVEDPNGNGHVDVAWTGYGYRQTTPLTGGPESSPADADTDDDGVADLEELQDPRLNPLHFDSDEDGLSDGLELGRSNLVVVNGITYTDTGKRVLGVLDWPTWQKFEGDVSPTTQLPITTDVDNPDSDGDGILDGLEDLNHNGKFADISSALNGAAELSPSPYDGNGDGRLDGLDSDNDGITDGRELLVYGYQASSGFSYSFEQAMASWGGSFDNMKFDPGNPFETDPRRGSTDPDGVLDGKDLHPRSDALMSFGFGAYQQINRIDPNAGACNDCGFKVDLSVSVSLDTPAGRYAFATEEIADWYTQDERTFNDLPNDEALRLLDEQTKPTSIVGRLDVVDQAVNLDLPDNVDLLERRDANIVLTLSAVDIDWGAPDDVVDISPIRHQGTFNKALSLTAGPKTGLVDPIRIEEANGAADGVGDDDAHLKVTFGHDLLPYFLQPVLAGGLIAAPPGETCLGVSDCVA